MRASVTIVCFAALILIGSPASARDPFPGADSEPPPEPAAVPLVAPPGLYYVTETYAGDVVTTQGPLTTYATLTIHESTGSYARVIDVVGRGEPSAFDGLAFNGRRALADGRLVAGTYYENFVLAGHGFVPVSIVFFQADSERAAGGAAAAPISAQASAATSPRVVPIVSITRDGPSLGRLEVLRGRPVALWLRASVDGSEARVRSWSLEGGPAGDPAATAGTGAEPFRTAWRSLAPPGQAHRLLFRLIVDGPGGAGPEVTAIVDVVVRSPALES